MTFQTIFLNFACKRLALVFMSVSQNIFSKEGICDHETVVVLAVVLLVSLDNALNGMPPPLID